MKKSTVCEALVTLYLRLNGYFTTGLIVHSEEHGNVRSEIDCLAVRHPHHNQDDREVSTSQFLQVADPTLVDVVICEVKSNPKQVRFNGSIQNENLIALSYLLNWAGVFEKEHIKSVASRLRPLLVEGVACNEAREGIVEGRARVRALLCSPTQLEGDKKSWRLTGNEILQFADECFAPFERRPLCSVKYDNHLWGEQLEPIVVWFKKRKPGDPLTIEALFQYLGV